MLSTLFLSWSCRLSSMTLRLKSCFICFELLCVQASFETYYDYTVLQSTSLVLVRFGWKTYITETREFLKTNFAQIYWRSKYNCLKGVCFTKTFRHLNESNKCYIVHSYVLKCKLVDKSSHWHLSARIYKGNYLDKYASFHKVSANMS